MGVDLVERIHKPRLAQHILQRFVRRKPRNILLQLRLQRFRQRVVQMRQQMRTPPLQPPRQQMLQIEAVQMGTGRLRRAQPFAQRHASTSSAACLSLRA